MSRILNCFSKPSTTSSSQTLHPLRHDEGTAFHSAPNLSVHHRNNGYENLTLHFIGEKRGRRAQANMRDESLSTERGRGNEEGRDMQRGRRSRIRQEFGDNISGLQLDPEPPRLPPLGETGRIMMTEIQPIGEVEAELEGERHGGIRRFRMRVRDYCTPGERRVVEEWIVGCGRARGKGFVKPAKEGRGVDERSEGEDEGEVEGVVRVRGGGRGWPEWGIGWGAYKFLS